MNVSGTEFREVWAVDFEFMAPDGERPWPLCLVARELGSGRLLRIWQDDLHRLPRPPYPVGPDCLIVAYYASAEIGCHLALNWPVPANILDLYAEFRCLTNGMPTACGNSIIGAQVYFGLDSISITEKDSMRELALRGGPYTEEEKVALLDYCQLDMDALVNLLQKMGPYTK